MQLITKFLALASITAVASASLLTHVNALAFSNLAVTPLEAAVTVYHAQSIPSWQLHAHSRGLWSSWMAMQYRYLDGQLLLWPHLLWR
ncbi:hypothetical protein BT96DRAFT_512420 [Gymnopus androsaceus JB14]|uniref:Uncharacterized protein n=1 Tax=Gymnopus androsaceus JB14 TaxID=1447944 RepID=A0A6A4HZ91_9AGAR|nr:hypothetical protein BT96DRAFT_512420 [Gymnopus androsaceus JB14]